MPAEKQVREAGREAGVQREAQTQPSKPSALPVKRRSWKSPAACPGTGWTPNGGDTGSGETPRPRGKPRPEGMAHPG